MLSSDRAFHGLTCGALSLMNGEYWRKGFGPLLPETVTVPFGDLAALEKELATRRHAAFFVEPIQAEGGIRVPEPGYLKDAQDLCRRYGSLLVADEVQTGMFRTGPFLASHHFGITPDIVVLAKALSGGLVPVSAVLMSDAVHSLRVQLLQTLDCPRLYLWRKQSLHARRNGNPRCAGKARASASALRKWVWNCSGNWPKLSPVTRW